MILDLAVVGEPLWDICCDHGYLAEAALYSKNFPKVYFVDQVPHITEALERRLIKKGHNPNSYQVLTVDGGKISQQMAGTIVIAGVGADLQIEMLQSMQKAGYLKAQRLVLNPFKDLPRMKELEACGWTLVNEKSVTESGRERKIFVFERSGVSI